MPAVHHEAAFAEALSEYHLHTLRFPVRHRIEVLVKTRHEALAEAANDTSRFHAILVVLESLLGRETGHADVVAGLTVTTRVAKIHNVDGVMTAGLSGRQ